MRRVMRVNSFPLKGPNIAFIWKFFLYLKIPSPLAIPLRQEAQFRACQRSIGNGRSLKVLARESFHR